MLNLTRYPGEKIIVTHEPSGEKLTIEIAAVNRDKAVYLKFAARKTFLIDREEIHEDKKRRGNDDTRTDRIQRHPQ